MVDGGEAGLTEDVAGPDHQRRDAARLELPLDRGAIETIAQHERIAHPRDLRVPAGAGPHDLVLVVSEEVVEALPAEPPPLVVVGELVELDEPVRRAELRRLEVVADGVEQEHEIVGRAVSQRPEAIRLAVPRAEEVRLRATPPPAQREATVQEPLVIDPDEAAVAGGGDGVATSEARH